MANVGSLRFDIADLPMDVFELADRGLTVESLTVGHGMAENGASDSSGFCSGFCGGGSSSSSCSCGGGGFCGGGGSCSCGGSCSH
ncbi:hypothetical protein KALB_3595 [Kutzneria albida DSM 43870]|uniref:GE37468 family thiazolyl peptide n=1 Tax=Kutzneria albida DSM 43870 TaxID=1449976 RepID=W5WFL3_9PSEU|nr:hypothetical protein KALB_3595 [Kutzneria albida DSM 43870]